MTNPVLPSPPTNSHRLRSAATAALQAAEAVAALAPIVADLCRVSADLIDRGRHRPASEPCTCGGRGRPCYGCSVAGGQLYSGEPEPTETNGESRG